MSEITEHSLSLASGVRLEYTTTGSRSSNAIVFVHGWPDSWFSFSAVLEALPAHVFAIAVSLRGFGDSDAPDDGYDVGTFAADVVELTERLGITSMVCVGHSLGSVVALRVAADRPDLVAGIVLIAGFATFQADLVEETNGVLADLDDPVSEGFAREFQSGTLAGPVPDAFFDRLVDESRKAPARVWRDAFGAIAAPAALEAVHRVAVPTLLIWGDSDALIPRAEQESILSIIAGSRLVVYEGVGHSPNWEQPARVATDIAAFAAQLHRSVGRA